MFDYIPEIFSNVLESTTNFPAKRIVFTQSYDYVLELLDYGKTWKDYGVTDVFTTSKTLANYTKELFGELNTKVVPVGISITSASASFLIVTSFVEP